LVGLLFARLQQCPGGNRHNHPEVTSQLSRCCLAGPKSSIAEALWPPYLPPSSWGRVTVGVTVGVESRHWTLRSKVHSQPVYLSRATSHCLPGPSARATVPSPIDQRHRNLNHPATVLSCDISLRLTGPSVGRSFRRDEPVSDFSPVVPGDNYSLSERRERVKSFLGFWGRKSGLETTLWVH